MIDRSFVRSVSLCFVERSLASSDSDDDDDDDDDDARVFRRAHSSKVDGRRDATRRDATDESSGLMIKSKL